jgi:hypothetical protein
VQEIYAALSRDRDLMKAASKELRDRGIAKARAEADYQTVKNRRALELKAEGCSASLIQMTIKGDPEVNKKLFERDCAEVLYDSAKEALNCYKLDARLLEAQLEREWNDSNRM